ncbi:TlpA family protein disulfide reductase [Pedobacter sp. PWIIR3]
MNKLRIMLILLRFISLVAVFNLNLSQYVEAQESNNSNQYVPKIGEPIANYVFTDLIGTDKTKVGIFDSKGKWLVLDWWTTICSSCISNMPKLNKMRADFRKDVEFILIGQSSTDKNNYSYRVKDVFKKLKNKYNLDLTAAFDSASFDLFGLQSVPFILVVNPEGKIVAKTYSLDSAALSALIDGRDVKLNYSYTKGETHRISKWDDRLPLLTSGKMANGGIDTNFLYRSILAKWDNSMFQYFTTGFSDIDSISPNMLYPGKGVAYGFSLTELVKLAALGTPEWSDEDTILYKSYSPALLLETSNNNRFGAGNETTGENMYSYNISIPGTTPAQLRKHLLKELEDAFSFKLTIEDRKIPVYRLIISNKANFEHAKSKTGKFSSIYNLNKKNWILKALPLKNLPHRLIAAARQERKQKFPIILDETHQNALLDINLPLDDFDFTEVVKYLNKVGLNLVDGTAIIKCLVVTDASASKLREKL